MELKAATFCKFCSPFTDDIDALNRVEIIKPERVDNF